MTDTIIRVENLSKRYQLNHQGGGGSGGLRHALQDLAQAPVHWLKRAAGRKPAQIQGQPSAAGTEEFWALKDVSFEIKRGDVVGIIGRNGAGKSTLLKMLSRITEPTTGQIEINGRVSSLLEVGTGFHPELTGRENIFLNGAILGMKRAEILRKFDEIVAFAEVEKFLDTPVKRYSSGMYVRLAFAVAAHLEPDVLIVDEVLAVGDAQFQKKCLGKIQDVSAGGRTVLFVSHNISAILQLTKTAILLSQGRMVFQGPSVRATEEYLARGREGSMVEFAVEHLSRKFVGSQAARLVGFQFNRVAPIFSHHEDFAFTATVRANQDFPRIRFSMTIFAADGTPVGSCFSPEQPGLSAGEIAEVGIVLPTPRLAPGQYYCGIAVGKGDHRTGHVDYDVVLDTLHFEISPEEGDEGTVAGWTHGWGTIVFPDLVLSQTSINQATINHATQARYV